MRNKAKRRQRLCVKCAGTVTKAFELGTYRAVVSTDKRTDSDGVMWTVWKLACGHEQESLAGGL